MGRLRSYVSDTSGPVSAGRRAIGRAAVPSDIDRLKKNGRRPPGHTAELRDELAPLQVEVPR